MCASMFWKNSFKLVKGLRLSTDVKKFNMKHSLTIGRLLNLIPTTNYRRFYSILLIVMCLCAL